MFIVVLSLGMTDLLFALDSIPAIYGLTKEPYLVFTANIFALMGLRQLYFLIGDLLKRLVYLSYGLAVLLAFIGVKLILHAMHENELPFINGGEHIEWAPEIPIWLSLVAIVGILGVTTVLSLPRTARDRAEARADGLAWADEARRAASCCCRRWSASPAGAAADPRAARRGSSAPARRRPAPRRPSSRRSRPAGPITFDCGPDPVTIVMKQTAKVVNTNPVTVIDGGGRSR